MTTDNLDFNAIQGGQLRSVAATGVALAIALVVAALLHPSALLEWLNGLPVNDMVDASIAQADQVTQWLAGFDLHALFDGVRATITAWKEADW